MGGASARQTPGRQAAAAAQHVQTVQACAHTGARGRALTDDDGRQARAAAHHNAHNGARAQPVAAAGGGGGGGGAPNGLCRKDHLPRSVEVDLGGGTAYCRA